MSGYISNVPLGNQTISSTQSPINTNFTVINTAFAVDHTAMITATNQGYHQKATFVQQGSDPAAVSSAPILYTKQVSYPGGVNRTELFMIGASGDGGEVIQLTETRNLAPSASNGYSFLPGGVVVQWGTVNAIGNGGTVSFPIAFPNACVNVQVTLNIASTVSPIGINGFNTTGFIFRTTAAGNVPITFFAIGN